MRLGEKEWIDAGLRAIAERGVDAVRVERLAETLKVTKGSFYWHFKDRAALLERLLEVWSERTTGDVIAQLDTAGGDAESRLEQLLLISYGSRGRLERGIRAWAAQDEMAQKALEKIDQRRVAYLATLLSESGLPPAESKTRARFAYHAMVGRFMSGTQPDKGVRLKAEVAMLVSMLSTEARRARG
jgi:AcrR family transcriptional regulator